MGQLIQNFNWSDTHLGHPGSWPSGLKSALEILLHTSFPMFLFWGEELSFFYNDAFRNQMADVRLHPSALGKAGELGCKAIWTDIWPFIDMVLTSGETVQQQNLSLVLDRDGKKKHTWWSLNYAPVKDALGHVKGVLVLAQETTAQVLLQTSLKEEKEQLEYALDAGELGAWSLNTDTNAFTCNNKTREIFGLPADEYFDLDIALNAIVEEDRERIKQAITEALTYGSRGYEAEYTLINRKTGEEKIIRARGKAYFNEDARPFRFSGTLQDVTAERTYRKELEKLKQMIEVSSDSIALATLDGRMKYMNLAGRQLFGILPYEDISHFRVKDLYSEEQYEFINKTILPVLVTKQRYNGEVKIKHQVTGEEIPCYGSYIIVPDPATGKPISRGVTFRDLRSELAAKKELEDSEKRFRNLVEIATVATAVYIGEEMRIQWANEAMLRLWGKESSVIGKTVREALPELEGQPFHQQLHDVYVTGETYEGKEDRGDLVVDGKLQTFYFNFSYKALRDIDGKIYGILNMAMDVTEQVQAKKHLEESEQNFINLIMQAPVGICLIKGADLMVELANDNYLKLVDRKRENFVHRKLLEGLPEIADQGFDELLRNVMKTGEVYHGHEQPVVLVRNGQKEVIYVNFVYEPLFTDGRSDRILVTAVDITTQVEARRLIEIAEERARMAIDAADFGTFEHNFESNQLIFSDRSFELFETADGSTIESFVANIHPADKKVREEAHRVARETGVLDYEVRIVKKDKSFRWVAAQGKLYCNEKGEPARLLGILSDVTERKALEEELERRVKQRTNELVTINNELQQFAYLASHDLQEPLRKIQVFAGLIPKELPGINEKAKEYLQKVTASASRMSILINNLLEFSQISNISSQFKPVDLNLVMSKIEEDFELLIKEKKASISHMQLPVIEAVPLQMNQLFYNLMSNALKFSKAGAPPQVNIHVAKMTPEQVAANPTLHANLTYYHLQFIDKGIGFRQEAADKIFTIFQRLHAKDAYSGTGIGLALCKKIVLNHKGIIYATSAEGEGSVFHIILPEKQADKT